MQALVVDDTAVFRQQIKQLLEGFERIDKAKVASNSKIALMMSQQEPIDLITIDQHLPDLSGVETIKELRAQGCGATIIMFAGQTRDFEDFAAQALALGANFVVAKPQTSDGSSFKQASKDITVELEPIVRQVLDDSAHLPVAGVAGPAATQVMAAASATTAIQADWPRVDLAAFKPVAIVVASSTGGPFALQEFVRQLQPPLRVPIMIAQHMPENFTGRLASNLEGVCGVPSGEATNGEHIKPNRIYVAPGNYHMTVGVHERKFYLYLDQEPKRNSVRPAADRLFETAAHHYRNNLMGFVLTGMGDDGRDGARRVKECGGGMMIQDKETATVWGMPAAVHAIGAFDHMSSISDCARVLAAMANQE